MSIHDKNSTNHLHTAIHMDNGTVVFSEAEAQGVTDIKARYEQWEPRFRELLYAAIGDPVTEKVEPGEYRHTWGEMEGK